MAHAPEVPPVADADLHALLARLAALPADAAPRWGRMTAQHLLEHLALVFSISNGRRTVAEGPPEEKRASLRRFLYSDRPFPPNLPNPVYGDALLPLHFPDYGAAQAALRKQTDAYFAYWAAHPDAAPMHPAFGPLDAAGWRQFHHKHLTHHLAQFGLDVA